MPEFEDVTQPSQFRSQLDYAPVAVIDRYTVLLKDGETTATIYPLQSPAELPPGLLAFLCDEFNMEVERGDTFPFFDALHIEQFQNYWFGSFAAVMVLGDSPTLEGARQWEKECLGTFFIRANYPGRCSHICTGSFIVNAGIRGKGIGRTLTDCYLQWAPKLGYSYSIFNLVFETNVAARRIWESLNFKRVGRIKSAGILKGHDTAVDAIMYGRELVNNSDPAIGAYRFDKIKFYLETGRYPAMADRQEKSRLRSSASHYRLENGKLMLKGREVVSDPVRQLQICSEVHMSNHGGINKTTAVVTEKFHWTRIKDTVATAIKNCPECRDPVKDAPVTKRSIPKKMASGAVVGKNGDANGLRRGRTSHDDVDAIVAAAQLHSLPGHRHEADSLLGHDLSGLDDNIIAAVEEAQRSHQNDPRTAHHPSYAAAAAAAVAAATGSGHYDYHNDYDHEYDSDDTHQDQHSRHQHQHPQDQHVRQSQQVPQQQQPPHENHPHQHQHSSHSSHSSHPHSQHHASSPRTSQHHASQHPSHNAPDPQDHADKNDIPVDPEVSAFDHNVDSGGDEIEIARALIQANEDKRDGMF